MIKSVIFDLDNTLMDFMRMKRAAVEAAAEAMIDAGLQIEKEILIEKIYAVYWREGIEDQQIFDKVLIKEFGYVDYKILASGIIRYRRAKEANIHLYPHVHMTLMQLVKKINSIKDRRSEGEKVRRSEAECLFFLSSWLPATGSWPLTDNIPSFPAFRPSGILAFHLTICGNRFALSFKTHRTNSIS